MNDYPRADMLVEPAWLAAHLEDPNLRIVDCDRPESWERAHIPGAVPVREHYYKNPDNALFIMEPDQFAATMSQLGIGDDTLVVGYDNLGARYSGRLWWCLSYYGHPQVRILNGGWPRWLGEGMPVSIAPVTVPPATFTPRINRDFYATADDVKKAIGRPEAIILDVRSDEEWRGKESRGNKRAGRIPGSVHIEWLQNVTGEHHILKPAAELREMFEKAGVTPDKEVVTVCQAGIRAAQAAMTLRLLGYEKVRTYDGSFAEWGNREDTPIEP
jgi:thiosulfate/3-mercaptopyruvate sulfurtransferase